MLNVAKFARVGMLLLGLAPGAAYAQVSNATITGVARDTTGAVLPGVMVEVASPALIEKARAALTDGSGQYRIIELRPGVYSVTFTLPGFSTFKTEGIELTPGFTATVNGELKVGDVSETITVSGQTPVVDVQSARTTAVMSRQVLDALPTGGEFQNVVQLIPGVAGNRGSDRDVGGQLGQTFGAMSIHGGSPRDQMFLLDGHTMDSGQTRGASNFQFTDGNYQEFVIDVGGQTAETPFGGIRINMVPRDGGNEFRGTFLANFANKSFAGTNIDDELRSRGLADPNNVKTLARATPTFGGALVRDKVWFYGTYNYQKNDNLVAGSYYNRAGAYPQYVADLGRQGVDTFYSHDTTARVTWQATPRNKLTGYYDYNNNCHCTWILAGAAAGPLVSPESVARMQATSHVFQGSWSSTVTSRLLLQASFMEHPQLTQQQPQEGQEHVVRIQDIGIPKNYGSSGQYIDWDQYKHVIRGSMSYVTGSHSVKVGSDFHRHRNDRPVERPYDYAYEFANGAPLNVLYQPTPNTDKAMLFAELGVYAQDQWTLKRLTLNAGIRFDYLRQGWPDTDLPPTINIPVQRTFAKAIFANFKDISPRIGGAYDVFGNGKTAIKGFANKYVGLGSSQLNVIQGAVAALGMDRRRWIDANGDFTVQGDPTDPLANGEIGPRTNGRFAQAVFPRRFDPDYVNGWGTRPGTNWEFSGTLQQELRPGMSATVGYFYRTFRNFEVIENAAVTPADYDPFCVTTPVDSRLDGGGGQLLCGFNDLKPNKVGLSDPVLTSASNYGGQKETWRGLDFTVDVRIGNGALLQGGISTGKTKTDTCALNDNPNVSFVNTLNADVTAGQAGVSGVPNSLSTTMCAAETPFITQGKLIGSYTFPYEIRFSGTLTNYLGPVILANNIYSAAQTTLGRAFTGATAVQLGILTPHRQYEDRRTQVDVRLARTFRFGTNRIEALVDVFNIFNNNSVTITNIVYGQTWQRPLGILPARLLKLGVQMYF